MNNTVDAPLPTHFVITSPLPCGHPEHHYRFGVGTKGNAWDLSIYMFLRCDACHAKVEIPSRSISFEVHRRK